MSARTATALLVDDSTSCDATRQRLEGDGYVVLVTRTGADGLTEARASAPNVIFLHLGKRGEGNVDFIQALRADDACRHIRVVVLTDRPGLTAGQKGLRPVNRDLL